MVVFYTSNIANSPENVKFKPEEKLPIRLWSSEVHISQAGISRLYSQISTYNR